MPVDWVEVADADEAALRGMTGSPTLPLAGSDPFAPEGLQPSLSCRLYRHTDGTTNSTPSVADLHRVLTEGGPADTTRKG
ncbi:hypothetical protein [Streptomyces albicerus]|uniref:hypothetical protein n=1 Tax=Streptomyces albicerus TaxID=2569859 RepID=UPI00124B01C0|nr:hypothetical protein [Streptomyces albicerus]